ncbi:MAG: sigma-70 family RNA polymerase sigma factor [Fuerstiella sp.]
MSSNADDTHKLLQRGIEGDQQAMSDLWDRHRERLQRLVLLRMDRRVQGRVDASDVLQDVFIDFAMRAPEYLKNPSISFYLWLRFLTGQRLQLVHRHHLGAKMRDAGREVSLQQQAMPHASSISLAAQLLGQFTPASHVVHRTEMQLMLQDAINDLDPMDREILALRHFEELSNVEAAHVLCIDPSAASSRHVRALKRLRQMLEGKPGFFPNPSTLL